VSSRRTDPGRRYPTGAGSGCRADDGTLSAAGDASQDCTGSCAAEDQSGVAAGVGFAVNLLGFGDYRRIADLRELKSNRGRALEPTRAHHLDDFAPNLRALGPNCLARGDRLRKGGREFLAGAGGAGIERCQQLHLDWRAWLE